MSSHVHGSEQLLAEVGCKGLRPDARVLVGGLGMGFTLRATLDLLGPGASVVVAELLPALVLWNRSFLSHLAAAPLEDPRVTLRTTDVADCLGESPGSFDAVLLDVDNGPDALTVPGNHWLYSPKGLGAAFRVIRPGGRLVVWSAYPSPPFVAALGRAGFGGSMQAVHARGKVRRGSKHFLFIGQRP